MEEDSKRRDRNSRLASALGIMHAGGVDGDLRTLGHPDVFIAADSVARFQPELQRHLFPVGLVNW